MINWAGKKKKQSSATQICIHFWDVSLIFHFCGILDKFGLKHLFKEIVWHFGQQPYLLSDGELVEKIATTLYVCPFNIRLQLADG